MASAGNDNAQEGVESNRNIRELENNIKKLKKCIHEANVIAFKIDAEGLGEEDGLKKGIFLGSIDLVGFIMKEITAGRFKIWKEVCFYLTTKLHEKEKVFEMLNEKWKDERIRLL
ncbi:hypothetical protein GVAV_001390 [Gurleya vavrai]